MGQQRNIIKPFPSDQSGCQQTLSSSLPAQILKVIPLRSFKGDSCYQMFYCYSNLVIFFCSSCAFLFHFDAWIDIQDVLSFMNIHLDFVNNCSYGNKYQVWNKVHIFKNLINFI